MRNFAVKAMTLAAVIMTAAAPAMAQGPGGSFFPADKTALGAVAVGIAAIGAGLGQGRAAGSACESIARNPGAYNRIFQTALIGLVFMETLVLFTFVAAFLKF